MKVKIIGLIMLSVVLTAFVSITNSCGQGTQNQRVCTHGCGKDNKQSTGSQPLFSNDEGSLLTSLGKYKIGIRSYSQWGINVHYR